MPVTAAPPPPGLAAADHPHAQADRLRRQLTVPWRRRGTIAAVTLLGVVLAGLVMVLVTPLYSATALVLVAAPQSRVVEMDAVMAGTPADAATVFTEAEVLRAPALLHRVAEAEGVYADPEFNAALKPAGLVSLALGMLPAEWRAVVLGRAPVEDPRSPAARADALEEFRDAVSVAPVHRSRVLRVTVESERPETAARLANALARAYLTAQLEAKFDATRKATEWLDTRLADLRAEVRAAETAVADFRTAQGLTETAEAPLTAQQMGEVSSQLILAESRRSEAEARLAAARRLAGGEGVPEVLNSPLVQRLKEQEASVLRTVSELTTRYGEKHPRMIDARAQLDEVRAKIAAEVGAIVAGLESEMRVARAREASLRNSLSRLEGRDAQEDTAAVTLRELEREAEASRLMYEGFLARFKETSAQESLQEPDSRVVSPAVVPVNPSHPRRLAWLGSAGVLSLMAGVALAYLREHLDRAVRTAAEAEAATGRAVLAMVPLAPGRTPADAVLDAPGDAAAEAVRSLRAQLLIRTRGAAPGVVAVTSSLPDEGKSTLALWLARTAAQAGRPAVLVDCDLRRPALARALGLPAGPTVLDVLSGEASLEEALADDPRTGLKVLPGGRAGVTALDLAEAEATAALLADLKARFDTVVVDAPPVLAVADGRLLARRADHVLYALRWDSTPREAAAEGVRALVDAGADPLPVITRIDLKRHARYGYGDAASVYGRYAAYYRA
ncbi:GumC family protein [Caenispirillum salinarum]|uniref:GumC family protein n=1 Tax=Caenispirillum salinarum TaxID=859058 RepID=UPI0038501E3B